MDTRTKQRAAFLFAIVIVCIAIGSGLGNAIFSNYFREVFSVDSVQRGLIEIPRESPGILCMLVVAALGFLGNVRLAVLAQILVCIGLTVMGLFSPSYGIMLVFLFLHSMGMHLFLPLNDAIAMQLAQDGKVGASLGHYKSISTLVSMLCAAAVFVGFRTGLFTFHSTVILPFILAAASTLLAVILLIVMCKDAPKGRTKNHRLLFRRDYMPYYMVTLAYGCQKRIKIVFAPWVIIELLAQGADTVALLTIITHFVGTAVAPLIGRMLDRIGIRKVLLVEAAYILFSFSVMGALAGMMANGHFASGGVLKWAIFGAYILCILFEQFNMAHSFLMRSIARDPSEVTETLSVGLGVDHVMAIAASPVLGWIWAAWGVQYVFYLAAVSALFQVAASVMMGKRGQRSTIC